MRKACGDANDFKISEESMKQGRMGQRMAEQITKLMEDKIAAGIIEMNNAKMKAYIY